MAELEASKAEPNKMIHSFSKCLLEKKKKLPPKPYVEYCRYNREENQPCP